MVAADKKGAAADGATLAFTDEAGVLMSPLVRTSLAPAGRTPVIRPPGRQRQKVSVVAALCLPAGGGRARLFHESLPDRYVDDVGYADFLREQVLARVRGPVVLLHDGATLHRGEWFGLLEQDYAARLTVHEFPPYAPELNPVEQLWNWVKDKELANYVPADLTELVLAVEHTIGLAARDQSRLRSFVEASELSW